MRSWAVALQSSSSTLSARPCPVVTHSLAELPVRHDERQNAGHLTLRIVEAQADGDGPCPNRGIDHAGGDAQSLPAGVCAGEADDPGIGVAHELLQAGEVGLVMETWTKSSCTLPAYSPCPPRECVSHVSLPMRQAQIER
jgi:hypothetical protein